MASSTATATATTMSVVALLVAAAAAGGEEEMELLRELATEGEQEARDFLAWHGMPGEEENLAARAEQALERRVGELRPLAQREAARASLRRGMAEIEATRAARAAREAAALAASAAGKALPHGAAKAERARRRALLGHIMPQAGKRRNVAR